MAAISSLVQFCLGPVARTAALRIEAASTCLAAVSRASIWSCVVAVGVSTSVAPPRACSTAERRDAGREIVVQGAWKTAGRAPDARRDPRPVAISDDRIVIWLAAWNGGGVGVDALAPNPGARGSCVVAGRLEGTQGRGRWTAAYSMPCSIHYSLHNSTIMRWFPGS